MFIAVLTRKRLDTKKFDGMAVKEHTAGKYFLTIIHDNYFSRCSESPAEIVFFESPVGSEDVSYNKIRFDENKQSLSVYKPTSSGRSIYYHSSNDEFFCASHLGLLRKAGILLQENPAMLPEYYVYRYVMPPNTLLKGIYQMPMGSTLKVDCLGDACTVHPLERYKPPMPAKNGVTLSEVADKSCSFLRQSMEGLSSKSESLAVLLSGGIDSSITTKLGRDLFGLDISYSTGYPFEAETSNMEKEYALTAKDALSINHEYFEATTNDYLYGLIDTIAAAEQPVHHLQSVMLYLLFKKGIPSDKKIVIQGVGAGGTFGNFRNHLYMLDKPVYRLFTFAPIRGIGGFIANATGRGIGFVNSLGNLHKMSLSLSDPHNPIWSWHDYGSREWVCDHFNVKPSDIFASQLASLEFYTDRSVFDVYSLYSLLGDEDITMSIWAKAAEACGKILHSPLYDESLLEYMFSVPWKIKLQPPQNCIRKEIARRCGVPEFIINRRKSGFGVAPKRWAQKGGTFEPFVALSSKVVDKDTIRSVQSTSPKLSMIYWNMLNYAIWKRLVINNESVEALKDELATE
ncbi:MAG: asparagine synthase C-terminal domain-containing protein [Candidatus Auribacterota bacterium]